MARDPDAAVAVAAVMLRGRKDHQAAEGPDGLGEEEAGLLHQGEEWHARKD